MAVSVTIVALPAPNQSVWELSSEKVPHLTLLFLDDHVKNVQRLEEFVAHATSTFHEFYLPVDSRGTLGDQSADVLFFNKKAAKPVCDFRTSLLGNDDISMAYNSTEQFPEWIPHLTMGFPESPAKPVKADQPNERIYSVLFDRIAVWTGNYEGVEFPLKRDDGLEPSMLASNGEAFLQHYGVKGMKWGVIRDKALGAGMAVKKATTSDDARTAQKVRSKAKITGVDSLSNKDLQTVITRMNLEQQYVGLKRVEHEQSLLGAGKKWAGNFVTDVLKDVSSSWLRNPFASRNNEGPVRTQAWTTGQNVAGALGSHTHKAIGR